MRTTTADDERVLPIEKRQATGLAAQLAGYTPMVERTSSFGHLGRIFAALLLCCLVLDLAMIGRCCAGDDPSGSGSLTVAAGADSSTLAPEHPPDDCFCCARPTVQARFELASADPTLIVPLGVASQLPISDPVSLYHPPQARV